MLRPDPGETIVAESRAAPGYAPFRHTPTADTPLPNSLTPLNPLSMVRAVDLPQRLDFRVFWMA